MQRPEIVRHPHLEARTVQLGMLGMWVCEQLPQGYAGRNIADQLFRSVTSVAANYAEASEPESDADFIHKLKVSLTRITNAPDVSAAPGRRGHSQSIFRDGVSRIRRITA